MHRYGPHPIILVLFACWLLWSFGIQTVGLRLWTEIEGKVVERRFTPSEGAPRYSTGYTLQAANGATTMYIAGATDGYLPRDLPVGAEIQKQRWHLSYEMDGKEIDDFPITFYGGIFALAAGLIVWAWLIWRTSRRK